MTVVVSGRKLLICVLLSMLCGTLSVRAEPDKTPEPRISAGITGGNSSKAMVQQKLQLVKMMLSTSSAMERAGRSEDESIRKQVAAALAQYASANDAFKADNFAQAETFADESLRLIEEISRMVPDPKQVAASQRKHYEQHLTELRNAEATYQDLRQRLGKEVKRGAPEYLAGIQKLKEKAQELAHDGMYDEASELLRDGHAQVITELNKILGSNALMYDIKFKNDLEEYEYELARYHSYEELAPIAYVELKPDEFTIKLSERYVQESRLMRDTAKEQAVKGDYRAAINTLLDAIKRMQTALRVLGLVLQD